MIFPALTSFINLLGFAVGAALYALLLLMVIRYPVKSYYENEATMPRFSIDRLLLATGILGLLWNAGGFLEWVNWDLLHTQFDPFFLAAAYSSLGFLPAVVVHSVLQKSDGERENRNETKSRLLMSAAYGLSAAAMIWHFYQVLLFDFAPSFDALRLLTFGYLIILAALLASSLRQTVGR
ncbi:MAG: hypothetical protein ABI891_05915, partial [Acidobacteriota bacterium]